MKNQSQTPNANLYPPDEDSGQFSHDISKMPDNPPKYSGHRRAHSDIVTLLPDDISFDSDLGIVGCFNGPEEDLFHVVESSCLQVQTQNDNYVHDRHKVKHHQHSMSMDCSTTFNPEDTPLTDANTSVSAAKLAELVLVDPKRAKRIWANRQSAARSKERKIRYIAELEREVQILQTEATSLSTQLTLLQIDVHGLIDENNELRLRLQTMGQQAHLQDTLTDALKKEIHHLNLLTGQSLTNGGPMVNFPPLFGPNPQNNQPMHTMLTAQQYQQLQIQSQNHHHHPFQPPQHHQFQQQEQQQQRNKLYGYLWS